MRLHADEIAIQRDEQRDMANKLEEEIQAIHQSAKSEREKDPHQWGPAEWRRFWNLGPPGWPTREECK